MDQLKCLNLSFKAPHISSLSQLPFIGKIISQKLINSKAIFSVLTSSWNLSPNITIKSIDQNMVSCHFTHKEDRERILQKGLWSVTGYLLKLQF